MTKIENGVHMVKIPIEREILFYFFSLSLFFARLFILSLNPLYLLAKLGVLFINHSICLWKGDQYIHHNITFLGVWSLFLQINKEL